MVQESGHLWVQENLGEKDTPAQVTVSVSASSPGCRLIGAHWSLNIHAGNKEPRRSTGGLSAPC